MRQPGDVFQISHRSGSAAPALSRFIIRTGCLIIPPMASLRCNVPLLYALVGIHADAFRLAKTFRLLLMVFLLALPLLVYLFLKPRHIDGADS